jgi:diguanylate cyclase (GGDEF)-like protein
MLITIFEEKHSETVSQQRLKALLNLIGPDNKLENEDELIRTLHESVSLLIPWEAFAFVFFDPLEKQFKTVKVVNNTSLKYIGENLVIDISGTLVGKSIVTGIPVKIDDTSSGEYKRFSKIEDVSFDGSFLAIPLVYQEQNYGVLCFESLKKNVFTNSDIQFLRSSLNIISFVIYSYSSQKLLKSYMAFDVETRALNADTFKERLSSDLIKSELIKIPGALALIKIDDFLEQESLFDGNPFPKVLTTISETIAKEMTPLNILGRIDEKVFAVYFFNSTTKDVFIWAEKLRVKIARKPISVVSKQTTYTISVGVASTTNKLNVDEVIHNADLALQKAVERGGNTVKNIN